MVSIVIAVIILLYIIYVIRKKVRDIKEGNCCSCGNGCGTCKSSLKRRPKDGG